MAAYCEGNILWSVDQDLMKSKVETAVKLGFTVLVSNYEVTDLKTKKSKKNKEGEMPIKCASEVCIPQDVLSNLKTNGGKLQHYSRCTAVITDAAQTNRLQNSRDFLDYDILAVVPTSEKTFQLACGTLDVDIISFDFTRKLDFSLKRTQIKLAIQRGLYFEICYTPAIRDSTSKKYIIANAQSLISICKGKNVIISSACEKAIEMRSPFDAANLGLLFGLTKEQAKAALTTNYRSVLLHARTRKTANSVMTLEKTNCKDQADDEGVQLNPRKRPSQSHSSPTPVKEKKRKTS